MGNKGALQWTGPYIVHHQLCDTTYQLRELDGIVMRGSVAANHLKVFYYRGDHQTVRTVQHTNFALHAAIGSTSSPHASIMIGTLNQDILVTPPYLVSVKGSIVCLPDNQLLVFLPSVTPSAFTSSNLHHHYHPTIAELKPMDYNPVCYICYTSSSRIFHGHIHENLLGSSNVSDLESWALDALPLR